MMNKSFKILLSTCVLNVGRISAAESGVRGIKNWVRPVRYIQQAEKRRELIMHPEKAKPAPRSSFTDWNFKAELYAFGSRLSENFDQELLRQALVDQSFVHVERKRLEQLGIDSEITEFKDNRELAVHGLKLLNTTLTSFIKNEFPKFPAEGVESVLNHLTSNQVLGNISSLVGTKDLIQCSDYPPCDEVFATAFQAIVGALDKSSGGTRTEKFIVDFVASHLCGKDINDFWDIPQPWKLLMNLTKQEGILEPRILREAGRNTLLSVYVVGIYDENKQLLGTGIGETVDIAQEMAARDVLKEMFGTKGPMSPFEFQSKNHPIQLIPHVRNI